MLLIFQRKVLPIKTTKNIQLIIYYLAEQSKYRSSSFISFLLANIFDTQQQSNWYRIFSQSNFYLFSYLNRSKKVTNAMISRALLVMIERLRKKIKEEPEIVIGHKTELK